MVASQVHLVRHGEVFNPDGILYGRLSGFGLSKLGHRMAQASADELVSRGRRVSSLRVSPLQRTRESAAPIAEAFRLDPQLDERIIEPTNHFEGTVMKRALKNPANWPYLINPARPTWGEAYVSIERRMRAAMDDAFDSVDEGDIVLIGHQLPIWITHLAVAGERFWHDPRKRRCSLSSITTFERTIEPPADAPTTAASTPDVAAVPVERLIEVGYAEPAASLQVGARDVGAV
ncbi:MAG: histidine phosphatase family protein [Leifsonia sp.]